MSRRLLQGPYRVGPWPGLSTSGAIVLLLCALALGALESAFDWRSLPVLAVTALAPMAMATRIVNAPGAATAVCGAYLLPRTVWTLANSDVALPPLLLPAAFAFDITLWVRWQDIKRPKGRRRLPRELTWRRAAVAGATFGVVLVVVQAPLELLPSIAAVAGATVVGLVSVRGTGR